MRMLGAAARSAHTATATASAAPPMVTLSTAKLHHHQGFEWLVSVLIVVCIQLYFQLYFTYWTCKSSILNLENHNRSIVVVIL